MNKIEVSVGALGLIIAAAGAWVNFVIWGLTTTMGPRGQRPAILWILPIIAILSAVFVLISSYRRGKVRAGLWLALPSLVISALAIIMAGLVWTE